MPSDTEAASLKMGLQFRIITLCKQSPGARHHALWQDSGRASSTITPSFGLLECWSSKGIWMRDQGTRLTDLAAQWPDP